MRQSGVGQQVMVDTKNGESYDGNLDGIDTFMNLKLSKVVITSGEGTFSKCEEAFIRGNNIKSIQFEESIISKHQEQIKNRRK